VTINDNALRWRKSSHSGGGNDCVEVAFAGRSVRALVVGVRRADVSFESRNTQTPAFLKS
jgi:hypothetical protein